MWQVIGQERAVDFLRRSLANGQLPHALLLVGPRHVGKMTLALNLAQALNCSTDTTPCGDCTPCRKIAQGKHADVQVIGLIVGEDGKLKTEIIIDQVREMQRTASLKPFEGRHRVFIIEEAELLNTEAANCLLKTLEEPPPAVTFILLAANVRALLPTVVSRCQKVALYPLSPARVEEVLLGRPSLKDEPERARVLARLSRGCLGWALAALEDGRLLKERSEKMEALVALADAGLDERFTYAGHLATQFGRDRRSVRETLDLWLTWWRDLLLMKSGCSDFIVNIDRKAALESRAQDYTLAQVASFVRALGAAGEHLDRNANPRLALEVLMLSIPPKGQPFDRLRTQRKEEGEEAALRR